MTRGGFREGSGRKPLDPESKTVIVPITVTEKDRDYLSQRGDGNVSAGVREVIQESRYSDLVSTPRP